jgi:hypothetical protein
MLTGHVPFRGSAAEVMYEQLHAPLPLEAVKDVPRPVVALLKSLLAKNPVSRPQSPSDLHVLLCEAKSVSDKSRSDNFRRIRGSGKHGRAEALYHGPLSRGAARAQNLRAETHEGNAGLISALDFRPFLEAKLKNFTGREWLFQEIDQWRGAGSEHALLIIGETGIGKSARHEVSRAFSGNWVGCVPTRLVPKIRETRMIWGTSSTIGSLSRSCATK